MLKLILILLIILTPYLLQATEPPTVLLNEIAWMGTPSSSNDEWIELYNSTDAEIDLSGWRLEAMDGSPNIILAGTIPANGFFVLERTDDETLPDITAQQVYTGSLSNTGELLKLYTAENTLIDAITLTDDAWPGGDNATKQTLERATDLTWHTSEVAGGTSNAANSGGQTDTDEPAEEANDTAEKSETPSDDQPATTANKVETANKGAIKINEVLANPAAGTQTEFIELKNVSPRIINLSGWTLTTTNQEFQINTLKMLPGSIVVFDKQQTGLGLNNLKETIKLKSGTKIIDQLALKDSPVGQAYARAEDDIWYWLSLSTPGEENNLLRKADLPIPIFYPPKEIGINEFLTLDASDSISPKGYPLSYSWDFGNGMGATGVAVKTQYHATGTYEITLNAIAPNASSTSTAKIKVTAPKIEKAATAASDTNSLATTTTAFTTIPFIFISEFLADPNGTDTENEFIELFSQEQYPVNLTGWQLDDAEGGSKPYTINNVTIKPGQYIAFDRATTKLALNNTDDEVRLLAPNGQIVDVAAYDDSSEGKSFVLDEQFNWQPSNTPTPGEINILNQPSATDTATTAPAVLGASSGMLVEPAPTEPKSYTRYYLSTLSALAVVGVMAGLKRRKKV